MLTDYDHHLESAVLTLKPQWNELRLRRRHFEQQDDHRFSVEDFVLVGQPTVMFCITTKTQGAPWNFDYFPLAMLSVNAETHGLPEWFVFARSGRTSQNDRRLQFLFEPLSIRLLEHQENFANETGPEAKHESLRFYAGIEFSDLSVVPFSGQKPRSWRILSSAWISRCDRGFCGSIMWRALVGVTMSNLKMMIYTAFDGVQYDFTWRDEQEFQAVKRFLEERGAHVMGVSRNNKPTGETYVDVDTKEVMDDLGVFVKALREGKK